MKTKELLLALCLICTSTAFSQKMYLTRIHSPFEERKYTYGENHKVIETEEKSKDDMKRKFVYNELNQCIRQDNYQLMDDVEWRYVSYIDYTYDENGNLTTRINYNRDRTGTQGHIKSGLMSYEYNENNQLIIEHTGIYSPGEDELLPSMHRTFTYDDSGKMETVLTEENANIWGEPVWNESTKAVYHYNDLGKLVVDSALTVDYRSEWIYLVKNTYNYDENGNVILHERYTSGNGTSWSLSSFEEYEYDLSKSAAEYVYPQNHELKWPVLDDIVNERIKEIYHTRDDQGVMQLYDTYIYEYSPAEVDFIETVQPSDSGEMLICPNPVGESFTVKLKDKRMPLSIYDMEGRLKVMFSIAEGPLDVSELPTGTYFVKCGKHTAKLVKE